MAKLLIIIGSILLALGIVMHFAPWLLNWFGHLPGDIRIETEKSFIFMPLTSMLVVSGILTCLMYLLSFFK